ncbi:MAG TPA: hypothetical protein VK387_09095, partial [Thermoleophilaceae bacterium]|nr:hypothetical protein [Thermoleophilaceae bacterium]
GLFIDELGKFITSDNDYFFRPAAALIYVLFLGLFFAARGLSGRRPMASAEYVANALDLAADAVSRDLDEREKQRALEMLDRADPHDPVVGPLRRMLAELDALPVRGLRMYTRWARLVGRGYRSLIARPRFAAVIDWVFGVWALLGLAPLALFVASLAIGAPGRALESVVGDLSPVAVVGFASSIVSAALVGLGVRRLEKASGRVPRVRPRADGVDSRDRHLALLPRAVRHVLPARPRPRPARDNPVHDPVRACARAGGRRRGGSDAGSRRSPGGPRTGCEPGAGGSAVAG